MGLIKWIIRSVILVVAVLGLLIGWVFLMPQEQLGKITSDQLTAQLGRQVTLEKVGIALMPSPGLHAQNMRVANANWAGDRPMFEAVGASFGLDFKALFQGRISFRSITALYPTVNLERRADGRANWDLGGDSSGDSGGDTLALEAIDVLTITNGQVRFTDAGQTTRIDGMNMRLRWPNTKGPMQIQGALQPAGAPVSYDLSLHAPLSLMDGKPSTGDLTITTSGGKITYLGNLGATLAGKLGLELGDTAAAASDLGIAGLSLPRGLGQSVSGSANIAFDGKRLSLRDANLQLDQNSLSTEADITLGGAPHIKANVTLPNLDLSGLTATESDPAPTSKGWSNDPIDLSVLSAFNGDISFATDAMQVAGFDFGRTVAVMTNDRARAVFELRQLDGYEGQLSGEFVANNRDGLSVRANMDFAGIELEPLLKDAMDVDRFSGKADGRISLLGAGQSTQAIMSSLSGDGVLKAGPGVMKGIDLVAALTGRADGGTTVFKTATASFTVDEGVLRNDDLNMQLDRLTATGDGRINLGQRSMDYLFTVLAPDARNGQGLAVPVRVNGPWSKIKIHVDPADVIKKNFQDEKQKLEKEVETKVNQAVGRELGLDVQEGQSLEDAARDKLQQELEKQVGEGLLNLLGGN
ncbi:MAG: AsmA family protein [Pelagimonas sp.]|jgi:AsmA protein|nr:AsmA family protein [Pelagimonas sp.]